MMEEKNVYMKKLEQKKKERNEKLFSLEAFVVEFFPDILYR